MQHLRLDLSIWFIKNRFLILFIFDRSLVIADVTNIDIRSRVFMINIISTSISLDSPISKGTMRSVKLIHLVNVLFMTAIPLHLLLLLLFQHLFLLLGQLRMVLVELSAFL